MRQRKKYDEKTLQAKPYAVGQYVWMFQNVIPSKGTKKLLKNRRGPFMITELHQQGQFYRFCAAHYENLKQTKDRQQGQGLSPQVNHRRCSARNKQKSRIRISAA